ncbi:hydrolase [Lacinutrix iliipiscaria]|uniref:Hydrolase n=1 Tax=Lacinutrix iliipiscaria TaxID=1230532 RepID=A0ABW5WP91_9FLAO
MKNKIFMYLFIFAALLIVFQYVNSKNIHEANAAKIEDYKSKIVKYKDSVRDIGDRAFGLSEFTLGYSEEALNYIEKRGYESDQVIALIEETLYELNLRAEPHPLIPYAPMTENGKMIVNAVRVLNHKWVITNFNDGEYWGELFLKYNIEANGEITFELIDSFLYPTN